MQNYLPREIHYTFWDRLYSRQYQSLNSNKIRKHEAAINELCKRKLLPKLNQLADERFWDNLRLKSQYNDEVGIIYEHFNKIKPLAHLNTRQIIRLLQEEIDPLIVAYQHVIAEIESENDDLHLLPYFLRLSHDTILAQIRSNLDSLAILKGHIYYGLLARSKVHELLQSNRHVDDVLMGVAKEINTLGVLDKPLNVMGSYQATLDDNQRLTIHDIFKNLKKQAELQAPQVLAGVNFDELVLDEIIAPIPGRGSIILRPKKENQRDKHQLREFTKNAIEALNLKSYIKRLFTFKQILKPSNFLPEIVTYYFNLAWKFRYVAVAILCFVAYQYLMALISPFLVVALGTSTLSSISNVLFYTLGIAPLWFYAWNGVKDFFTHWKKQELLESLIVLEESQRFISTRLSQTPVDLPFFDIKSLLISVDKYQKQLDDTKSIVTRSNFFERFFCKGSIQDQANEIKEQILRQQNLIQGLVKQLAHHISERIGDEIELMEVDLKKKQLVQSIDHQQIARLQEFVNKYGDSNAIKQFEINANVIHRWAVQIETFSILDKKANESTTKQPWGKRKVREDILKGWNTLLSVFIPDDKQREACLTLNEFLMGTKQLTPAQFDEKIKALQQGENTPRILGKIQNYVFNTLHGRQPQAAALLSPKYKRVINQWHQDHQDKIKEANEVISKIFSSANSSGDELSLIMDKYSDHDLSRFYEYLDGDDFHAWVQQQQGSVIKRKNAAREFFEDYQGQTSRAFQFIRLVPLHEKPKIAHDVAKKRLAWFLAHLDELDPAQPFNEEDINIFKNVWAHEEGFCFTSTVMESEEFEQKDSTLMVNFLKACIKNGLGFSWSLLNKYTAKDKKDPEVITPQKDLLSKKPQVDVTAEQPARRKFDVK